MHTPFFVLSVLTLAALCAGQAGRKHGPSDYAGTWVGEHNGTIYCKLIVEPSTPLKGTMSTGNIRTDDDGNLQDVGAAEEVFAIKNPRIADDGSMQFEWAGDETDPEPIHFELWLLGERRAELRFLNMPKGVKLKPPVLEKR